MSLHVFEIAWGATEFYVAESADDALRQLREAVGSDYEEELAEATVKQWPDTKALSIVQTDEPDQPKITKTCAEWATERGCIASSEY